MTEVIPDSRAVAHAPGDAELIAMVRGGDVAAFGVLYERHQAAAVRLARQLVAAPDADDLAADGFAKVLNALQNGKGPDESFRAYLLTAVRSVHVDRIRAGAKLTLTDDEESLDRRVEFIDPAAMNFERGAAAEAFASLPERWQLVLWHLDVEGQKPADIAPLLDMSPNSISALAYRAREGLRQAYLQRHLSTAPDEACSWTTAKLGAYVRKGLSGRDNGKVDAHLDNCARCTGLYLELREINSDLGAVLAPALLGTAAIGYLTGGSIAGAVGIAGVAKAMGAGISKVTIVPVKNAASNPGPAGVAAAAVLVVAGAAAAGMMATGGDEPPAAPPAADAPAAPPAAPPAPPAPPPAPKAETPAAEPPAAEQPPEVVAADPPTTTKPDPTPAPKLAPPKAKPPKKPHPEQACKDRGGLQIRDGALVELELPIELLDLGTIAYIGDREKC